MSTTLEIRKSRSHIRTLFVSLSRTAQWTVASCKATPIQMLQGISISIRGDTFSDWISHRFSHSLCLATPLQVSLRCLVKKISFKGEFSPSICSSILSIFSAGSGGVLSLSPSPWEPAYLSLRWHTDVSITSSSPLEKTKRFGLV